MGKKGYVIQHCRRKIMVIMRSGENELLSAVGNILGEEYRMYSIIKYTLTNWRIIVEGENKGGWFSRSETKTLFEIPLNSVRNVSAIKGGFFKGSDRVNIEFQVNTTVTRGGVTSEELQIKNIEFIVKDINRWADEIKKAVAVL
jgi:hypothetical protein